MFSDRNGYLKYRPSPAETLAETKLENRVRPEQHE